MKLFCSLVLCGVLAPASLLPAQTVRSAAGANFVSILPAVDAFRADLGTLNPNMAGSFGTGRREINWDGVPDAFSSPNSLPANFFNVNSPRGVVFATPGTGFATSSVAGSSAAVQFGNIDPTYSTLFEPFTAQRLFTSLGSNLIDVSFFIAGSTTPALTTGFGAIFSDVDLPNTTSLQFFSEADLSLGTFFVPSFAGNETFSFLGVSFNNAVVSRVRITSGNGVLAPGNVSNDLVVLDDFIYGEPRSRTITAVPEAGASVFGVGMGLLVLLAVYRRHKAQVDPRR